MVKGPLPCFPLAVAQSLVPYSLEYPRTMKCYEQNTNQYLNTQQTVLSDLKKLIT
jgi:hypothetical protein